MPFKTQQVNSLPDDKYLMAEGQILTGGTGGNTLSPVVINGARTAIAAMGEIWVNSNTLLLVMAGKICWVGDIVLNCDGPLQLAVTINEGGYAGYTNTTSTTYTYTSANGGSYVIPVNRFLREFGTLIYSTLSTTSTGTRPLYGIYCLGWQFTNDLNFGAKKTILMVGDSITWSNMGSDLSGSQFSGDNLYSFRTKNYLTNIGKSVRVIEKGFGGSSSFEWAKAIDNGYISGIDYDLILIQLGANDANFSSTNLLGTGTVSSTAASTTLTFSSAQTLKAGQRISANGFLLGTVSADTTASTTATLLANALSVQTAQAFYITGATATIGTGTVTFPTATAASQAITITGVGTAFNTQLAVGNLFAVNGIYLGVIASIASATSMVVTSTAAFYALTSPSVFYFSVYAATTSPTQYIAAISAYDFNIKKIIAFTRKSPLSRVRNASIIINGTPITDQTSRLGSIADYRQTAYNIANDPIIGGIANKVYYYDQSTSFGLNAIAANDLNYNNGTTGFGSNERIQGSRVHIGGYGHGLIAFGRGNNDYNAVTASTASTTVTFLNNINLASGDPVYAAVGGVLTLLGTLSGAISNAKTGTLNSNSTTTVTAAPMGLLGIVMQTNFYTNIDS